MKETILAIIEMDDEEETRGWSGYRVVTSQQVITLLIDNETQCCEDWGYMVADEADKEFYIGAEVQSITVMDEDRNVLTVGEGNDHGDGEDDRYTNTVFITLETDKGRLQFTLYNHHNGYYGHGVKITTEAGVLNATL